MVTAISQWASVQMMAGTAVGQAMSTAGAAVAVGSAAATVVQAANGDPYAQTALASPDVYGAATLWNEVGEVIRGICSASRALPAAYSRLSRDIFPDGGGAVDIQGAPYTIARLIRTQDWPIWGTNATAAEAGDFTYIARSGTVREALSRIPKSWRMVPQDKGVGYTFTNPDPAASVNEIRIKVPMATFNDDWQSFAQLRIGKKVETDYPGRDIYGFVYYDRNMHINSDNNAIHLRLAFDP